MGWHEANARHVELLLQRFGVPITIGSTPETGIFIEPGKQIERNGAVVVTTEPMLQLKTSVAATVTNNSTVITIGGVQYESFEKMPDGSGFVLLNLTTDF